MIPLSILALIILPFLLIIPYAKHTKQKVIYRIIEKHFLAQTHLSSWYSTTVTKDITKQLQFLPRKKLISIIDSLNTNKYKQLFAILKQTTIQNINIILEKNSRPTQHIQKAELALLQFDYKKLENIAKKIKPSTDADFARLSYIQAHIALKNGDLETASQLTNFAIGKFHKLGFLYEEAQSYILNGTIYKVCGITDTAHMMLQTALKIFQQINAYSKQAEALGLLGMLTTTEERFSETQTYFNDALQLFQKQKDLIGEASIINQQALLALLTQNFLEAISLSKKALKIYQHQNNYQGQAFSYDIIAQSAFAISKPRLALSSAKNAAHLYQQSNNFSAHLEMLQLQAQIYIEKSKLPDAEKILRKIISMSPKQSSCFHIANAYNLLGIVYLKQNDFRRAEGIFQQSLKSELFNERWCGAAIDYANIAITSQHRGNQEQSKKYWQMAIQYAKQSDNSNLIDLIKQQAPNL